VTAQPRAPRGRSLAAGLLGVLAVLASLLVLPGSAAAAAPSHSAASAAARGAVPFGVGLRETRDKVRVAPRRLGREQPATFVAAERPAGTGRGPAPVGAALAAAVALTGLVAAALVTCARPARRSLRTPGTRRDRAPPALALA
jgi:hypothetical protein